MSWVFGFGRLLLLLVLLKLPVSKAEYDRNRNVVFLGEMRGGRGGGGARRGKVRFIAPFQRIDFFSLLLSHADKVSMDRFFIFFSLSFHFFLDCGFYFWWTTKPLRAEFRSVCSELPPNPSLVFYSKE